MNEFSENIRSYIAVMDANKQFASVEQSKTFRFALESLQELVSDKLAEIEGKEQFILKILHLFDAQNETSEMVQTLVESFVNPFLHDNIIELDSMIVCFIKAAPHFHDNARMWIFETHSTLLFAITDSANSVVNSHKEFIQLLKNQPLETITAFKGNLSDFITGIGDLAVVDRIGTLIKWIDIFLKSQQSQTVVWIS